VTPTLHKHHIIPKHVGGTDDPSNFEMLTIPDHAEAHRVLWEQHGRWEDWLAWKGLAGLIGKDDLVRLAHKMKGPRVSAGRRGIPSWNKGKHGVYSDAHRAAISKARAETYRVTFPDGRVEHITNLNARKRDLPYRALVNKLYSGKGKTHLITVGLNAGWGIERIPR